MFGIEGQFAAQLTINGNDDPIKASDLKELTIIESAGNSLPEVILSFKSEDESLMTQLSSGSVISGKMGANTEELKDFEISIQKFSSVPDGGRERFYQTSGFVNNSDYIINKDYLISDEKSAIEVAITKLSKYFTVVSNITKSKDKQRWIQPSIVDKAFVNDLLMKADLGDSAPLYAITSNGEFIIKDILKDLNRSGDNAYDWRLTAESTDPAKDLVYSSDSILSSQAGFINNWVGYGRTINLFNMLSGDLTPISELPEPLMALSQELDKKSDIEAKFAGTELSSDNVHPNYWAAYTHNLMIQASLSRIGLVVTIPNKYIAVKPLDLVMFSAPSLSNEEESGEYHSGLYYVSKVSRTVQGNTMATTLLLNREALNQVRNKA